VIVASIRSGRKAAVSVLVTAALVALSGCGAVHPGAAAVVDSTTISHDTVDGLAQALCTANVAGAEAAGQAQKFTTRGTREGALQVLLDARISQLFGEAENVQPSQQMVSQALDQNRDLIEALPEDERDAYRDALKEYAEGQLMLVEIGRTSLEEQGAAEVPDDQAIAEGQRLRGEFVQTIDVEVDPRYGSFTDDTLQAGGSALSVAQSERARAGDQAQPGSDFVDGLPISQRCS
jgi:hypothetical protein